MWSLGIGATFIALVGGMSLIGTFTEALDEGTTLENGVSSDHELLIAPMR